MEFFSHSCPHCIKFRPVYQQLSEMLAGKARFFRIDVMLSEDNRELAHSRGVRTVPTIEVFYRGRVIGSLTGYHHIKKVFNAIDESLIRKEEYVGPGTLLQEPQARYEKEEEVKLSFKDCQIRWCKEAKVSSKDRRIIKRNLKGMTGIIEEAMSYTKKRTLENAVEEMRFSVVPGVYAVVEYCEDAWHMGLETVNSYIGEVVGKGMPLICLLDDKAVETESI